jgi:Anti-sigma-28 factor, FlgM
MNADREDHVRDLRQQIEAGEYEVDPTAVADAIVRRLRDATAPRGGSCANPGPPSPAGRIRTSARIRTARRRRL